MKTAEIYVFNHLMEVQYSVVSVNGTSELLIDSYRFAKPDTEIWFDDEPPSYVIHMSDLMPEVEKCLWRHLFGESDAA